MSAGQQLHLSGDLKGSVSIATQQGLHFNQSSQQQHPNANSSHHQQHHHTQQQQQPQQTNLGSQQQPMGGGVTSGSMLGPSGMMGSGGGGVGMGSPAGMHHLSNQQQQQMMNNDSYSLTQSQTINFTQQTLRQRTTGGVVGGPQMQAGAGGANGELVTFHTFNPKHESQDTI